MVLRKSCIVVLASLAVSLPASFDTAHAGVLVLKNGDRITGKIKRLWDEEISIDPKYSDTFDVDLDAVAYIDSERDFEVEIDGRHMQIARFSGADEDGNQILVIGGEQVVLPLQDIAELEEIEDYFDWEANADLNANGSSGNTENLNTRLNLDGLLKVGRNRHVADAVFARETQGPILTKDQSTINYSYQRLFKGSPWFFGLNGGFERDPFRELKYRYTLSTGIGYDFWDQARRSFNLELRGGFQQEEIGGEQQNNSVIGVTMRFRYDIFGDDLELFADATFGKAFGDRLYETFVSRTGIRYKMTDYFYANFEIDIDYDSAPPDGVEPTDVTWVVGIGTDF